MKEALRPSTYIKKRGGGGEEEKVKSPSGGVSIPLRTQRLFFPFSCVDVAKPRRKEEEGEELLFIISVVDVSLCVLSS